MKPILPDSPMNKTETEFSWMLWGLKQSCEIIDYKFEPMKFILSRNVEGARNAVTYTPDFMIVYPERFEFVDVKAKGKLKAVISKSGKPMKKPWSSMRDDARAKINIAAELFPWFRWAVWYRGADGIWTKEAV